MNRTFFLLVLLACAARGYSQQVQVIDTAWIDAMKQQQNDTLYVVNFWATWCKPCVEELPFFEAAGEKFSGKKVKVLLVSTDMRKDLNTRVKEFVKARGLKQQVLFMNEVNGDVWIDKVSPQWSGAIPATWFINGSSGVNTLHEGGLTGEELNSLINRYLSH